MGSYSPPANAQQQANRIVNAVVQQRLLEPRDPLGEPSGGPLCSQVGVENNRGGGNRSSQADATSVVWDNAVILGIIEDAGVLDGGVEPVARAVSSVVGGMDGTRRRSRGDVLSHIERS